MRHPKRDIYTEDYFADLLRTAGYKITPARIGVLDILAQATQPLSAGDIFSLLERRRRIAVNYVTVYRSLNAFEVDALIRRVPLERESVYYEFAETEEHYFICSRCGEVRTFQTSLLEHIARDVKRAGARIIERPSLQVYGICTKCT